MKHYPVSVALYWLPLAIAVVAMSGLIYFAVQQDLRLSANDPQIQMAQDAAAQLANGQTPDSVVPQTTVAIDQSLAPFMIVFDASGNVVASSAVLNNQVPTPPAGVFASTLKKNPNMITWQPQPGVREAAVVVATSEQSPRYVLVGRSLKEVENREMALEHDIAAVAGITLVVTLFVVSLLVPLKRRA